jgi:hypothetical protein
MIRWWLVLLLLLGGGGVTSPRAATTFVASPTGNDAAGTPCTDAQPCSVRRGLLTMSCSNNDALELLDGVYRGDNYMLNLASHVPNKSGTGAGARCTVRARNDGGVFIDGQFARIPFWTDRNNWWLFEGFDAGNSNDGVATVFQTNNTLLRRICFSNNINTNPGTNVHVFQVGGAGDATGTANNTFEDLCIFGVGRNTIIDYINAGANTFRRVWARHEGWFSTATNGGSPVLQLGYDSQHNATLENVITVLATREQMETDTACIGECNSSITIRNDAPGGAAGYKFFGWIAYGQDNSRIPLNGQYMSLRGQGAAKVETTDVFLDARAAPANVRGLVTDSATQTVTRATIIKLSSTPASTQNNGVWTNVNECNTTAGTVGPLFGSCPNFYTGDTPGTGARNCLEYLNGTLTGTKLWPWRMDDRIKAALARANAAGTGGGALQGGAGAGYAPNTVTSEIAARYGPIPTACNRAGSFTPNFPVATDFPSTPVLDDFNRANGALGANWVNTFTPNTPFTIVSNQAAADGGGNNARMQWVGGLFSGTHEVWALWPAPPNCCTALSFAGENGTEGSQWRLGLDISGGNTHAIIRKIDSGGNLAALLLDVDLGTDVSATPNQGFGIRVSSTQTISIYWKWTDGNWYRVGSVIDTSLPMANTAIGFAGVGAFIRVDDFGGGTCCGGAISPSSVGRLGTQFPKPRRRRFATRLPLKRAA